jgi:phosphatidylglycerophosphatase A
LGAWHPAVLIATWFGAGRLPIAPGTWGSLAALPFAWAIHLEFGPAGLALAAAALFPIGWWASSVYCRYSRAKDPGAIVVDEVAAQWFTLVAAPLDPVYYGIGFLLFRLADIAKPWPASWADREVAGGLGVMLDDMLAGVYALAALWALTLIVP